MKTRSSRRRFLGAAAGAAAGWWILEDPRAARSSEASSAIRVALVGAGGRGTWFVDSIPRMEQIVALCDVDDRKVADARRRWEDLATRFAASPHDWERSAAPAYRRLADSRPPAFRDFRVMLDELGKGIDAVIVAVPDHTHAVATAAALHAGKHVYCEKPLTRTVSESRALRDLARRSRVATSMGNQGTASDQFRRALELIRDGTIGEVKEAHVWNNDGGADRKEPPRGTAPAPEGFDWDLWLGPAAARPFHREWISRHLWREFGTNQLGNWASHSANLAFMALRVHELWQADPAREPHPLIRVEATSSGLNRLSFPRWEVIRWEIPERSGLPPVAITWHNGPSPGVRQGLEAMTGDLDWGDKKEKKWMDFAGSAIVGTKGTIHATGHNATFRVLPEERFRDVVKEPPKSVEPSRGHEADWFIACRGGKPAWASFEYAAPLNEFLMLGNVATQFEGKLEFDPIECKVVNHPEADRMLHHEYRPGWSL